MIGNVFYILHVLRTGSVSKCDTWHVELCLFSGLLWQERLQQILHIHFACKLSWSSWSFTKIPHFFSVGSTFPLGIDFNFLNILIKQSFIIRLHSCWGHWTPVMWTYCYMTWSNKKIICNKSKNQLLLQLHFIQRFISKFFMFLHKLIHKQFINLFIDNLWIWFNDFSITVIPHL